jgi:hypothetical protein
MCEWGLTGSLLPMKFIANTDAEVAPNARPLVAAVPANHLITKVAPNACPLIASPQSHRPIPKEASNAALPLILSHLFAAAAEPTTCSAAASSADSSRPPC